MDTKIDELYLLYTSQKNGYRIKCFHRVIFLLKEFYFSIILREKLVKKVLRRQGINKSPILVLFLILYKYFLLCNLILVLVHFSSMSDSDETDVLSSLRVKYDLTRCSCQHIQHSILHPIDNSLSF